MKPNEQETNVKTGKWNLPETRNLVVNTFMNALIKKGGSSWAQGIPDLRQQLEKYEENVNTSAKNEGRYFDILISKIETINSLPDAAVPEPMPSNSAGSEWQEQVHQRVQKMKSTYFMKLIDNYENLRDKLKQLESSPQEIRTQHLENFSRHRSIFGFIFSVLGVSKSQITYDFKEKVDLAENFILQIVSANNVPSPSSTSQREICEMKSSQLLRTKQISQQNNLQVQEVTKQSSNLRQDLSHQSIIEGPANIVQAAEACGVSDSTLKSEISHTPMLISDELSPAMQGLVKVLVSMSPGALSTSVSDIRNIVNLDDAKPTLKSIDGPPDMKMSHNINAVAFDTSRMCDITSGSFNWFTGADKLDFNSVPSEVKRPIVEENCALSQEIKEINNKLIDSEVVIDEKESIQSGEGWVVKVLFNAITVNLNEQSLFTGDKKSLIKPIRLLVRTSYPFSSPVILDNMPMKYSEGLDGLSAKANLKLKVSLLSMDQPWSLRDLAKSWDHCAREAIREYAEANGGGSFTSK